jgi:hypothetical protein
MLDEKGINDLKYELYYFNDNTIEGKLLLIWKKVVDIKEKLSEMENK